MSLLLAACCLKSGACCMLHVARCAVHAGCCSLHIVRCMLSGCCLEGVCCTLRVVRCIFPVACCMSSVAYSPLHGAQRLLSIAHFRVGVCRTLSVGSCLLAFSLLHVARCSVARSPLHGVCFRLPAPSVPCRMVCAVCCLAHVASRRVTRCMTHALSRMWSLARCLSRLARSLLHVVCCVLQSDSEPSCWQRSAETRCRPRCACVRA